ncbi:MAG: hypothetical protein OXC26_08625 [Albidovulum sp.]|nr:hypothetical protein [Albidovulum sp.]
MGNNQQLFVLRQAHGYPSFLGGTMILVENRRCELIRENRRGKFETDSVIPQIIRGLVRSQSNSNTSIR